MTNTKSITFDIDFLTAHVKDRGLVILEAAIKEDPNLLKDILRAGWGEGTSIENPSVGRKLLEKLVALKSPEDAKEALHLYFKNASKETITRQLIHTSPESKEYSPLVFWLNRSHNLEIYPSARELIKEAKNLGADFDHVFMCSTYDNKLSKYKSSGHTILSYSLPTENPDLSDKNIYSSKLQEEIIDRAIFLLDAGKSFDNCIANHLVRLTPRRGIAWANVFIEQKATTATEILHLTSKTKDFNPEIKATLSSMSAMEAINETISKKLASSAAR